MKKDWVPDEGQILASYESKSSPGDWHHVCVPTKPGLPIYCTCRCWKFGLRKETNADGTVRRSCPHLVLYNEGIF